MKTPDKLLLAFGIWGGKGRTDEIWRTRWIVTAGLLLVVLFTCGFLLWTYGFALLAKFISRGKLLGEADTPSETRDAESKAARKDSRLRSGDPDEA